MDVKNKILWHMSVNNFIFCVKDNWPARYVITYVRKIWEIYRLTGVSEKMVTYIATLPLSVFKDLKFNEN